MHILEQIFRIHNPQLEYPYDDEIFNLLFDWFRESGISIADFENDFFEPALKAIRTQENEDRYFQSNFEQARRDHYIRLGYLYLFYHHPHNPLFQRFFQLENRYLVETIVRWYGHGSLIRSYPEIFSIPETGCALAQYYHAIHARIDVNYSYLPHNIELLKFNAGPDHFNRVFNYIKAQTFKEKAYLLFILSRSTSQQYTYTTNSDGQPEVSGREIITTTEYDAGIEEAFIESIEQCNRLYQLNLSRENFALLNEFLSTLQPAKKKTKTEEETEAVLALAGQVKGKEAEMLETLIYFLENHYLGANQQEIAALLKKLSASPACQPDWLEAQLAAQSGLQGSNPDLIFKYAYTVAMQAQKNQLSYAHRLVQLYEKALWQQTRIRPYSKGLALLRELAATIEDPQERQLQNSKLSEFHYFDNYFQWSSLLVDEQDKTHSAIKNFVAELNTVIPLALVNVPKRTYNENDYLFKLNFNNEEFLISRERLLTEINTLLEKGAPAYRLVSLPLHEVSRNEYRDSTILFALALMSYEEYQYFLSHCLQPFVYQLAPNESRIGNEELWEYLMNYSELSKINYTIKDAPPYAAFKAQQQAATATKTIENLFLEDVNWTWFKEKYIDELSSREQWYRIMHIILQCNTGSKPKAQWLEELKAELEKTGIEQYFKELQVLLTASFKEECWYFDIYRTALRGFIWTCTHIAPNDLSLGIVKTLVEAAYTKVAGIGPRSTALGNLGLDALVATGSDAAFGMLNIMRNKTRYNRFALALEKSIDKFKAGSEIPEQLLADKAIPKFGFENGTRTITAGSYRLQLGFEQGKLTRQWLDAEGKKIKTVPAEISAGQPQLLREINEEIKQINSVFGDLKKRIKTYWLYNRSWSFANWKSCLPEHSLLYPHINGLIWLNNSRRLSFILLNNQMLLADGSLHQPGEDDEICLWHPVLDTAENVLAWQDYIWKNQVKQPERQAFREHYPFSATELALTETPRFAHHFLEVQKLMAMANTAGWIFTYEHEGQNWPRVYIKPLNLTAHLRCEYDRNSFAIPTKSLYFTAGNSVKINTYPQKQEWENLPLSALPAVTLSEICRDIDLFIATTSVGNHPELSENRQEYKSYHTEYHQGLFSDNASAKIRKRIIEALIPVLKIQSPGFEGNYLIVNGSQQSYRINLGSGFAQVKDSQQHLNLIPDISALKKDKKLRLPVEDDETLYIILAKALYLQNDAEHAQP